MNFPGPQQSNINQGPGISKDTVMTPNKLIESEFINVGGNN